MHMYVLRCIKLNALVVFVGDLACKYMVVCVCVCVHVCVCVCVCVCVIIIIAYTPLVTFISFDLPSLRSYEYKFNFITM